MLMLYCSTNSFSRYQNSKYPSCNRSGETCHNYFACLHNFWLTNSFAAFVDTAYQTAHSNPFSFYSYHTMYHIDLNHWILSFPLWHENTEVISLFMSWKQLLFSFFLLWNIQHELLKDRNRVDGFCSVCLSPFLYSCIIIFYLKLHTLKL